MLKLTLLTALFSATMLNSIVAFAQNQYILSRINDPVTLDGLSNESAWQGISPLPVVQHTPNFGKEPSERTEILVAYDDDYLYVAGRLYDKDPSQIMATSFQRDSDSPANDWFGIIVDTFNDKENAVGFFTTPGGLRWDGTTSNDAQGNSPVSTNWNTFWDVAVEQNSDGWFVEMKIPLSSLRFQEEEGRVVMGMISWRFIAHKGERAIFPAIPPNWGHYSIWKPSQAQEVVLEGVRSRTPFYITPYLLGGLGQAFELNKTKTAYRRIDNSAREVGLDVKYGLTSNLTLDATVNTDFAQVEADNQQINLTRFSLFFPEKRSFFQERASMFEFSFDETNRLFYSRRIGIHEGKPVRIYGGARVVGRVGLWDLGFIDMQTAPVEGLSSENLGVLRLRRRVLNPYSYTGGMITSRIGEDGSYNAAYGLDGILRLFGDEYLTFKWAQTFESSRERQLLSLDPARIQINWERRIFKGFSYSLDYSRSGSTYNPKLGFELRNDYTQLTGRMLHGWVPGEELPMLRSQVLLEGKLVRRNADGLTESAEFGPGTIFTTKTVYYGEFFLKRFYERVIQSFKLSDKVEVPAGEYGFYSVQGWFNTPRRLPLSGHIEFDVGSFYDGRRYSVGTGAIWKMSSHLDLSATYEFNRIAFPDRSQKFTAHIARLRALHMLNTKFSVTAFVQYNSATNALIGNFRLRYNPGEGNDLYLVYNESINTDRYRADPVLPFSNNRTVMLKYTYTFSI